jgi:hypothetical protein
MSEQTSESTESTTEQQPPAGEQRQEETKTFDAEYVAKLRSEAAKYRTEAKANSDAAKRLAEIEDSQRSDAEKAAARVKELESEAANARRDALRYRIASKHKIDDEDAELFLTGSDEDTLTRQAERLQAREAARVAAAEADSVERKKRGNHVPREGTTTTAPEGDEAETARLLFGG